MTDIGLMILAYNLAHNAGSADLKQYRSLPEPEKHLVIQIIENDGPLPPEIEALLNSSDENQFAGASGAPTFESM